MIVLAGLLKVTGAKEPNVIVWLALATELVGMAMVWIEAPPPLTEMSPP